jgi:hypothetical protein
MRLLRIRDRPGNDMRQNLCERARRVKRAASCLVGLRDAHRVFLGLRLSASEILAKAPEQRAPGDDLPKLVQNSGGIVRSFFLPPSPPAANCFSTRVSHCSLFTTILLT